jgi:hypothetical protein
MLVIEDRDAAPFRLEDFDDVLEELVTRIKRLPEFVARVIAMLADDHHAIDGQFVRTERERVGDAGGKLEIVTFRAAAREIAFGKLIDVKPGEIDPRLLPGTSPRIAECVAIEEVLRVRMLAHNRADEGDLLARRGGCRVRDAGHRSGSRGEEK